MDACGNRGDGGNRLTERKLFAGRQPYNALAANPGGGGVFLRAEVTLPSTILMTGLTGARTITFVREWL
jgi:hypothetical protein